MNSDNLKAGIAWRMALLDLARQRQQEVTADQIEYFEAGYAAGTASAAALVRQLDARPSAEVMMATARRLMAELNDAPDDVEEDCRNCQARGIGYLHAELLQHMARERPEPPAAPGDDDPGQRLAALEALHSAVVAHREMFEGTSDEYNMTASYITAALDILAGRNAARPLPAAGPDESRIAALIAQHTGIRKEDDPPLFAELRRLVEAALSVNQEAEACGCVPCLGPLASASRMVLCPTCGNKRCPRANDHRHACTGSNEPGQPGSAYPAAVPEPTEIERTNEK